MSLTILSGVGKITGDGSRWTFIHGNSYVTVCLALCNSHVNVLSGNTICTSISDFMFIIAWDKAKFKKQTELKKILSK